MLTEAVSAMPFSRVGVVQLADCIVGSGMRVLGLDLRRSPPAIGKIRNVAGVAAVVFEVGKVSRNRRMLGNARLGEYS